MGGQRGFLPGHPPPPLAHSPQRVLALTLPAMLLIALSLLSALIVAAMCRIGTLDHPVERSSHSRPTPKGGGVGIVACFGAGMILAPAPMHGDWTLLAACLFLGRGQLPR